MTFLTLDDKEECVGYYSDKKLIFDQPIPATLDKTWKYHPYLKNRHIKYANIYCGGKDYEEVCPEHLKDEWLLLNTKAKSYIRSFIEAKVSLKENCFFDLIPKSFLIDFCDIKCQITDWVFENYPEPKDYQFKSDLEILISDIKKQKILFDQESVKNSMHTSKVKEFYQNYSIKNNHIQYNQFQTKTGRLTTEENTFPILNLSKSLRGFIKPENDFFLDIDYNAAEVRVFLALNDFKQPATDIHEWNMDKFGYPDRNEAKIDFISWMYGKKNVKEKEFQKYYDTEKIKAKYWNGEAVTNHYGRCIQSDEFHSVNYTVQSTTADMSLRQAIKVSKLLENCQSKIKMIIHDNIVVDMKKEDKNMIQDIIRTYNDTDFGTFKSSVKIGKNLGEMRKIVI